MSTIVSTFDVRVVLQIHSSFSTLSSTDVWLERSFALPFPPFDGLHIYHEADNDGGRYTTHLVGSERDNGASHDPVEIHWDMAKQEFVVYLEDRTIYWAKLNKRSHEPLDEIVAEYVATGWQQRSE